MWQCIATCDHASWHVTCIWHVTAHRDIDCASWHVTAHRDVTCIVTRDLHRDTWPRIVTCDRASWHVTAHRDMWPCIITNLFMIKPTRCTNFTNLSWHETLHVSGSSSAHHQEFIHCTLGNGICHTGFVASFRAGAYAPARKLSTNMYDIHHCRVYSE